MVKRTAAFLGAAAGLAVALRLARACLRASESAALAESVAPGEGGAAVPEVAPRRRRASRRTTIATLAAIAAGLAVAVGGTAAVLALTLPDGGGAAVDAAALLEPAALIEPAAVTSAPAAGEDVAGGAGDRTPVTAVAKAAPAVAVLPEADVVAEQPSGTPESGGSDAGRDAPPPAAHAAASLGELPDAFAEDLPGALPAPGPRVVQIPPNIGTTAAGSGMAASTVPAEPSVIPLERDQAPGAGSLEGVETEIGAADPERPSIVIEERGASHASRVAPQGSLEALLAELEPMFDLDDYVAGITVIDLETGEAISINGDVEFQAASTIKFFVTLSAMRDIELGFYSLASIETIIYDIMVHQKNEAARELTYLTGLQVVNARLRAWGLTETTIRHPSGYPEESVPYYPDNDNLTSPHDAARGLEMLYNAEIANPELSRAFVDRLTQLTRKEGIRAGVPLGEGWVYYKVGWLPEGDHSDVHDMGIVEFRRGDETISYIVAIYTEGARPQWYAWNLVREASGVVWQHFAHVRYPQAP